MRCFQLLAVLWMTLAMGYAAQTPSISVQVILEGVPKTIEPDVLNTLPLIAYAHYGHDSEERMKMLYIRSKTALTEALQPYGYYHATIQSTLTPVGTSYDSPSHVSPLNDSSSNASRAADAHPPEPTQWIARFQVTLNAPIRIEHIDIQIDYPHPNSPHDAMLDALTPPFKIHDILNQMTYEAYKSELLNTAVEEGYLDAKLSVHQLRIDRHRNTARVILTLDTGPLYHFGKITFVQDDPVFHDAFLHRFVQFHAGDPYQYPRVQGLQNDLNQTQYFSSVTISPQIHRANHRVDLTVHVNKAPSQEYTLGIGYGTETHLRGLIGWQLNRIGPNGHRFSAQIQASSLYRTLTTQYIIPGKNPLTDSTIIGASQGYATLIPYTSIETMAGIEEVHAFGRIKTHLGIQSRWINYSQTNVPETHTGYLTPYGSLVYRDQHPSTYFKTGTVARWSIEGSLHALMSSQSYLKSILSLSETAPLSESTALMFEGQAGGIITSNLDALAAPLRFYAGGVGTVRGYSYMSLSPISAQGTLTGGQYLATSSITLKQHIFEAFSLLGFYDIGNVTDTLRSFDLMQGAGLGFSWETAVGPIECYFSHPVGTPGGWQVDLRVGGG